jgi:transposase-like protein
MPTINEWPDHLSELPDDTQIRNHGKLADCPDCGEEHTPKLAQEYEGEVVQMYFCPECGSRVPKGKVRDDPDDGVHAAK